MKINWADDAARVAERLRAQARAKGEDATEFLDLAPEIPVRSHVVPLPLAEANTALARLRAGELTGAAVLVP